MTSALDDFEDAAGDFLRADPARNTLLLTIPATLRRRGLDSYGGGQPVFGWYEPPGGTVEAVFLQTPPFPVVVSGLTSDTADPLVEILGGGKVNGPADGVEALSQAWRTRTGGVPTTSARRRLYQLAELIPPRPMPEGAARVAAPGDRETLIAWFEEFGREVGESSSNISRNVDDRIGYGGLTLWESDGGPVSMAGVTRPAGGVVRVAPVYTPKSLRGRGYAAAVTAEVSRRALDDGHVVVLFTDLANPTSNALYQRLGYREIQDFALVDLPAAGGRPT